MADAKLVLIEVNPRAPGGALWRSALARTGYDLELVDAMLQLGLDIPSHIQPEHRHVLHYPFYAQQAGMLQSWGDLDKLEASGLSDFTIDFAISLGHVFQAVDMFEEPYLAFAVAHADSFTGILEKCDRILAAAPPHMALDYS